MQHVAHACSIVGVFENAEKARLARQDLLLAGFGEGDIQWQTDTTRSAEGLGFWDSIKEMFGSRDVYAYQEAERRGRHILIVHTSEDTAEIDRAAEILRRYNPIDIDESCAAGTTGQTLNKSESIPVIEEEMRIGKRQQIAGGVRLYSYVTETPVEEDVALREERVRVERRATDRPAGPEEFHEDVIEAVETREVPVVSKEARVVEEVSLEKDVEQRKEKVRGKVRRQDVEAEHLDEDATKRKEPPAEQP